MKVERSLLLIVGVLLMRFVPLDFLTELESRYRQYTDVYPQVQAQASFNQPGYRPGDSVFFSVHYRYENLKPVAGTHLLYLDVVAHDQQVKQRIRFKVKDGAAHNQFLLPATLEPGLYRFYVYSDWMRNFGSDSFFYRTISVTTKNRIIRSYPTRSLRVNPEGGQLIAGITNQLYAYGNPNETVLIQDQAGSVQATFALNSVGVGSCQLTPSPDQTYRAVQGGNMISLPVRKDGVSLHLEPGQEWTAQLSVALDSKWRAIPIYMVVVAQGQLLMKQEVNLAAGKLKLSLPTYTQAPTYHQVFILTEQGEELAYRVFVPYATRRAEVKLRLQPEVRQREPFTIGIGVMDEANQVQAADFSVSIIQSQLFDRETPIPAYLQKYPEVYEWAAQYPNHYESSLHEFLGIQQGNRIPWPQILQNKLPEVHFPFKGELTLRGKVSSIENGKPAQDSTRVIAFLQKNAMGYEAYTRNGEFSIPLVFDFWDEDVIFFTLRYRDRILDSKFTVQLAEDTLTFNQNWAFKEANEEDRYSGFAIKRDVVNQSYSFFSNTNQENLNLLSPNQILEEEFQGADFTVRIADYIVFPTMEDLLREIVTFVQVRKKGNETSVRLFYRYEKSVVFFKQEPIYVIDGFMTSDTEYFLSLKPEDLISLKVINNPNKLAQLGGLGQNGIIFVESKRGNLGEPLKSKLFPVTGLTKPITFSESKWLTGLPANRPSLRSTLYWNPLANSEARFFETTLTTTDDLGPMLIRVHGITRSGRPFYAEQEFQVKPNNNRK